MADIILSTQNGEPVASSRQIAESFGKEHKNVMQSIENISAENSAVTQMFFKTTYTAGTGKAYPMYLMNRDGFTLLAYGLYWQGSAGVEAEVHCSVQRHGEAAGAAPAAFPG